MLFRSNTTTGIIVEAVVDLAHKLGLTIVAEGVETAEQREHVHALGCDFSQGYFFAKPLPRDDVEQLLQLRPGQPSARYLPITSS